MDGQPGEHERLAEILSKFDHEKKARYEREMALAKDLGVQPNDKYRLAVAGTLAADLPDRVRDMEIKDITRREERRQYDDWRKKEAAEYQRTRDNGSERKADEKIQALTERRTGREGEISDAQRARIDRMLTSTMRENANELTKRHHDNDGHGPNG